MKLPAMKVLLGGLWDFIWICYYYYYITGETPLQIQYPRCILTTIFSPENGPPRDRVIYHGQQHYHAAHQGTYSWIMPKIRWNIDRRGHLLYALLPHTPRAGGAPSSPPVSRGHFRTFLWRKLRGTTFSGRVKTFRHALVTTKLIGFT